MNTKLIQISVAMLGLLGGWGASPTSLAQVADTIYRGGPIVTINDAQPVAEAVAVRDGRIVAVGSDAAVLKWKGEKTRIVELQGGTLLPGFVDAHGHVMGGGLQALSANLLAPPDGNVTDIPSLQETLRVWIDENRESVEQVKFVIGFGYDPAQMTEQRHPTRDDLDVISTDLPIALVH